MGDRSTSETESGGLRQNDSRAAGSAHPCPVVPQTDQAITAGGPPARITVTTQGAADTAATLRQIADTIKFT